ncbi:hypothetical protein A5865_002679 [Enterococcus sp. 12E11_DIV0728]|nr:hypothetical protein A5865_002679 [Enterococcus sp. 12E11_DIV0728]
MNDDQIELLIKSISDISSVNIRKIMRLSHNNPRIAVIAANMVKDENVDFIENGKEILDNYYGQIIEENSLTSNEKISLFILSFNNKVNLTNREDLKEILDFFKIDFDSFSSALQQLHDKELCDIFQDKAARVSDQSLSDFVIVDFIANKKSSKVRDFFINLYPNHEKEIVETLVIVNNFNSSKEWIDYLTIEIKFVYNEIIADIDKERFLKQYGVIIPVESLAYVHEKIQGVADVEFQVSQKEFEEKKKNQGVFDPIIGILCSLSNSERFKDAGVLLMDYFRKRQDKIYEVFSAIKAHFDIEQEWDSYLEKRFSILEIFLNEKNVNELTALLITNIVDVSYTHLDVYKRQLLNSEFTLSYYHFDSFIRELPFLESKGILNSIEKKIDERWYLSNFLACKKVNNDETEELLLFLKNIKDQKIINSFNILSFINYIETDTIILKFLLFQYDEGNVLGSFFIPNYLSEDKAERIINIVGYKDLKRIYLNALEDENIDGSGQFFRCLLSERDADFISSYLIKLNSLRLNFNYVQRDVQIKSIWISSIAEEGIKKYLDFLIKENHVIYAGIDLYLENLFKANIERSFEFIKEEIINTEDEKKLVDLYNLSLEIFSDEISLSLFDLLRDKKIGSDFFEKLYLTMRSKNWSGSLVPLFDKDIIFLDKLLDIFEGIENISHSLVITKKIDLLKKEKEKELLSDYLE